LVSQARYVVRQLRNSTDELFNHALFITFTVREDISGRELSRQFNRWVKNIRYWLRSQGFDDTLYYVKVREKQKRGVYHYHVVLFGFRYLPISVVQRYWELGNVDIEGVKDKGRALYYIEKYLEKQEGARITGSYSLLSLFRPWYDSWVKSVHASWLACQVVWEWMRHGHWDVLPEVYAVAYNKVYNWGMHWSEVWHDMAKLHLGDVRYVGFQGV